MNLTQVWWKRFSFCFLFLYLSVVTLCANEVTKSNIPHWVTPSTVSYDWSNDKEQISSSYYCLNLEAQIHIPQETIYTTFAFKILNGEGVQEMSDISVSFDPLYQKVFIHEVNVCRDGEKIDKLRDHNFQVFHKEKNRDNYLYDGRLEAVLNIKDVRVGDIIEYSYSKVGFNPMLNKHLSYDLIQKYSGPTHAIRHRVLYKKETPLLFLENNGGTKGTVVENQGLLEYSWSKQEVQGFVFDDNVPAWFDPYPSITISDFRSWAQVNDLLVPAYRVSTIDQQRLITKIESLLPHSSKIDFIHKAIRFVQDEVRYLGIENGILSYKPHSPLQVLNQRFGDCKDKSLLLVSLLRGQGIEANPMLVHTDRRGHVQDDLPSFSAFNHCVVQIVREQDTLYIDPTINHQGGRVDSIYFPDYGYGLVIKEGTTKLQKLPLSKREPKRIELSYHFANIKDRATFRVKTIAKGRYADLLRSSFANSSIAEVEKNYLDYYSREYSEIRKEKSTVWTDDRDSLNQFIVEEAYSISNTLTKKKNESNHYCFDLYPNDFSDYLYPPSGGSRTMPYRTDLNADLDLSIAIKLPGKTSGYEGYQEFDGNAYRYTYLSKCMGDSIHIDHKYHRLKSDIPAEQVAQYLKEHEEMTPYLTYEAECKAGLVDYTLSVIGCFLFVLLLLSSLGICYWIYQNFEVTPEYSSRKEIKFQGELYLILAFLIYVPILFIYEVVVGGSIVGVEQWSLFISGTPSTQIVRCSLLFWNAFEFVLFLLLLKLFFQKRIVFVSLLSYYLIANVAVHFVLFVVVSLSDSTLDDAHLTSSNLYTTIVRSGILFYYLKRRNLIEQTFIHSWKGN